MIPARKLAKRFGRQFLSESLLLSRLSGFAGAAIGVAVTAGYAAIKRLPTTLSSTVLGGRIGAALAIGAVAGIYPVLRASRLAPTEALRAV